MPQIQVAICSPIPALRAGLRALISADPDISVAAAAANLDELMEMAMPVVETASPLDGPPPAAMVLIATSGVLEGRGRPDEDEGPGLPPDAALLLITNDTREALALAGMGLRAWGVLPPEATAEALHAAVRSVAEGLVVASTELMGTLLSGLAADRVARPESEEVYDKLTDREGEVLRLLAQGLTNKQVALSLHISEHTVKFHVSSIYSKLGASNRTEAVRKGARLGWVPM